MIIYGAILRFALVPEILTGMFMAILTGDKFLTVAHFWSMRATSFVLADLIGWTRLTEPADQRNIF
jgi:hypothetical protein